MEKLMDWLPKNIPSSGISPCLTHGDYKLDNVIFHPTEIKIIAVLDWELSTIGKSNFVAIIYFLIWKVTPMLILLIARWHIIYQELKFPPFRLSEKSIPVTEYHLQEILFFHIVNTCKDWEQEQAI